MSRSRFFPNNNELPTIARYMIDAVSERLGRPAHCRKVSTWEQWYVYDPVISFVQQGVKKEGQDIVLGTDMMLMTLSGSYSSIRQ
jgi:hypothetical protein